MIKIERAYFYLLKVLLFFLGVGVIKAHDELTFKGELVVLVEQSSLGMADVQVTVHSKAITQTAIKGPSV